MLGFTSLGLSLGTGLASGLTYYSASLAHDDYESAGDADAAKEFKDTTQSRTLASRVLLGTSLVFAATSATLLIIDGVRGKKETPSSAANSFAPKTRAPFVVAVNGGAVAGVVGEF